MYRVLKRIFDFVSSVIALLLFLPFLIIISLLIIIESRGGVFYRQVRVGRNGREFKIYKFRSMRTGADKEGRITIGNDKRVTRVGKFLRKTKLDEIPQLFNVVIGQMSIVGPRPEVPEYVRLYNDEQRKALAVKPGLTDIASLEYINEQEILGRSDDPGLTYIEEVMPAKLKLNLEYIAKRNFFFDLKLIFRTVFKIMRA